MATEGTKRKLAAILSADVKEYSRLMGQDERGTIRTLTAYKEAMSSLIQEYKGRVVDAPGDNLLAEFGSVVDAVNCAVEIQRELAERNAELPYNRRMEFRIGINLGDIVEEEKRIYGDGVNIAARVESLAEGGGICISGKVHEEVKNKLGLEYEFLGEQEVKNIAEPVPAYRVLSVPGAAAHRVVKAKKTVGRSWRNSIIVIVAVLVVGAGVAVWNFFLRPSPPSVEPAPVEKMASSLPDNPSIAVLPFDDLSREHDQEYFSDGITEDLITDLSKITALFVIGRNSTFAYKGKNIKTRQVAEELGVRYVLEGSVQKAGNQLRITAQLIDASTDVHVWGERYDGKLDDTFELQDKITEQIVKALAVQLTPGEQERISRKDTKNITAYDSFLKARAYYQGDTPEDFAKALSHFENAIESDPDYRQAYFFMALIYSKASKFGKRWLDALDLSNALVAEGQAKKYLELSKCKIVFVTSEKYTGNLGGIAGACAKCQRLADAAGLPGTYRAWLSDKTSSPSTTFTRWNGPYILVDGTEVARNWLGLTEDYHFVPIKITETGQDTGESFQWTNTGMSGGPGPCPCPERIDKYEGRIVRRAAVRDGSCQNWTSSNGDLYDGFYGNSIGLGSDWTYSLALTTTTQVADCDEMLRLYCFQQ